VRRRRQVAVRTPLPLVPADGGVWAGRIERNSYQHLRQLRRGVGRPRRARQPAPRSCGWV